MRLAFAILVLCCAAKAATNVQMIQTFTGGTNNGWLAQSVLDGGKFGPGTFDQQGLVGTYWKVGTNVPYRLPHWIAVGGTNFDQVSTNWAYYDIGSNAPANDWEQYRLTIPGGATGVASNLWISFYLLLDGVASSSFGAPNIDLLIMNGQFGGFCALQLQIRTNAEHYAFGHAQGTNGHSFAIATNVVYLVQLMRSALADSCECQFFNATNNFAPLVHAGGDTTSVGFITSGSTNSYEVRIQANYLNSSGYNGSGRIWMSSPIFGWGNSARPPAPETNVIVSDRYAPLIVGETLGLRGSRPSRTLETNVTAFGASTLSDDNTAAINNAIAAVASNGVNVVRFDEIYKIRGTVGFNKSGITLRGYNGGGILLGSGGDFNRGPSGLTAGQAQILWVTNGIVKGETNATLITNYATANVAGFIAPGQIYQLSQLDGRDPQVRRMAISGSERSISTQDIYIISTNGNAITFWPPARETYTNSPALVQRFTSAPIAMGMENFTITTTNAGVYETNGGVNIIQWQGEYNGWMTGCQILYGNAYAADFNNLIACEANSNVFRYPSFRATSHGGIQITGGHLYFYDNIVADHDDRSIQLFGGAWVGFAGNYFTNTSGQGVRYHAPGNVGIWEGNICDNCYFMLGDGYFGANLGSVANRNEVTQIDYRRFSSYGTMVGNVTTYAYQTGFPNLGNNETNGLSLYTGSMERRTLVSGLAWNEPRSWFTGGFGVPPYSGVNYTNISHTFTNVAVEISNGTNILGDFEHWPFSATGGYSIIFRDGTDTNRYWRYADFTNSPTEQISVDLRAWTFPSNFVMVLNRYMPISNGWTMMTVGPNNYQQRQTVENVTFQESLGWSGGVASDDVTFLPKRYPASLMFPNGAPSWALTNSFRWPWVQPESPVKTTNNPAKARYLVLLEGGGGGAEGGTGLPSATVTGRVTLTGRARIQ